jgi:drug/metabolite transporter (DMT)-like permease
MSLRTALLTLLALIAFAANSILCRMALRHGLIDPVAFTQLRLVAGALALSPLLILQRGAWWPRRAGAWRPALALFIYAFGFSLAYVALSAGTGALILFAMVQLTMIGLGIARGLRPALLEWTGLAIALGGLAYLLAPGLTAPPIAAAALMAGAGVAWGIYSVLGKSEADPATATARNFALTAPLAAILFVASPQWAHATPAGIALAVASGALTSGLGYIVWYRALKGLSTMHASIVQIASPVLVGIGGIVFLSEAFTLRFGAAAVLILGGIMLTIWAGGQSAQVRPQT